MKILHINDHAEWAGGAETYLLSLIPELERLGHEQSLVYAKGRGELAPRSYRVSELSLGTPAAERAAEMAMAEILQQVQPDIVHLHLTYNIGAVRACLGRVPVIIHGHHFRYLCPASSFFYRRNMEVCQRQAGLACFATTLRHRCLSPRPRYAVDYYRRVRWFSHEALRFAGVLAPSDSAGQRFVNAGFEKERVTTLPYFCPVSVSDSPRQFPNTPTVLFVGRALPSKGLDTFLEAGARLPDQVRLKMVGDFAGKVREIVESRAAGLGLAGRLDLRTWAERDKIREVYEDATVFAFPTTLPETMGIVGVESMASGVPVVASDIGGVREWLIDNQTGYLAEPKNAGDFAEKIHKLLFDESLNMKMGRHGQRLVREKFSPEGHINQLVDLYQRYMNEHRAGRAGGVH